MCRIKSECMLTRPCTVGLFIIRDFVSYFLSTSWLKTMKFSSHQDNIRPHAAFILTNGKSLTITIPTFRTSDTVQSMLKSSLPARKFDGRCRRSGSIISPVPILFPSSTSVCGQSSFASRVSCKYIIEVKTSIWK